MLNAENEWLVYFPFWGEGGIFEVRVMVKEEGGKYDNIVASVGSCNVRETYEERII